MQMQALFDGEDYPNILAIRDYFADSTIRLYRNIIINEKKEKKVILYCNIYYFCDMRSVKVFNSDFKKFMEELAENDRRKINYVIEYVKTNDRLISKFVKPIRDGIYEMRIESEGKIFRIFFIFDEGNIIVLLNVFQKKTQKTPKKEIEKAIRLKKEYYEAKDENPN